MLHFTKERKDMKTRPITTLFMLSSVDGKISTGASDALEADSGFSIIGGVRQGLRQYYEIEQTTDLWSLNSGRVQAKMGVNEKSLPHRTQASFVRDRQQEPDRTRNPLFLRTKSIVLLAFAISEYNRETCF
jgi:2,5-diamino-6-(ribosylamino)-4(3H)-pyrimidinone 5'-phosphate reductase